MVTNALWLISSLTIICIHRLFNTHQCKVFDGFVTVFFINSDPPNGRKARLLAVEIASHECHGLTNDVSATGLFVVTSQKPKPGTRLHLEVTMPGELPLFLEGVVMRQVLVPPELRQVVKSGFGIRYLLGSELMAELVPAMTSPVKEDPFLLTFGDILDPCLACLTVYPIH